MHRISISESGTIANITIDGTSRNCAIDWNDEGFPVLAEPLLIAVRIGKSGKKLWAVSAKIARNQNYSELRRNSEWILAPLGSALNSLNRNQVNQTIVSFWDVVPKELRSKR